MCSASRHYHPSTEHQFTITPTTAEPAKQDNSLILQSFTIPLFLDTRPSTSYNLYMHIVIGGDQFWACPSLAASVIRYLSEQTPIRERDVWMIERMSDSLEPQ